MRGRMFISISAAAGPRPKSRLSIWPFALSGALAPALTSAFTRVEDDLEFAAPKGDEHADLCISDPLDRPRHQELQGHDEPRGRCHQARRERRRPVPRTALDRR